LRRGLRATTGREGEERSKAALGFAREDAEFGRRGRSKRSAPTNGESNAGPKTGRGVTPRPPLL